MKRIGKEPVEHPQTKKSNFGARERELEIISIEKYLPVEIHWKIFSFCCEFHYKPLLAYSCVNIRCNSLVEDFLKHRINFKKPTLDFFTQLYYSQSVLRFRTNLSKAFDQKSLNQYCDYIQLWSLQNFLFTLKAGIFVLKFKSNLIDPNVQQDKKYNIRLSCSVPYDQFLLLKSFQKYLFADQFLVDLKNDEKKIDELFDFLYSVKSSIVVKMLLTTLIESVHILPSKDIENTIKSILLLCKLIYKQLINFDKTEPFISDILLCLESNDWELAEASLKFLNQCMLSYWTLERASTLNHPTTIHIQNAIPKLIGLLNHEMLEFREPALELLQAFEQNDYLTEEGSLIIIEHLNDKNHWSVNAHLLLLLRVSSLLSTDLEAKISLQFVDNIFQGLMDVIQYEDIHEGIASENFEKEDIEDFHNLFLILFWDKKSSEDINRILLRIIDVLWQIEYHPDFDSENGGIENR